MKKLGLLGTSAMRSGIFGIAVLIAAPAMAQVSATPTPDNPKPADTPDSVSAESDKNADDTAATDGEVVVTGSRIRRSTYTSPDPVNVITNQERTEAGFTTSTGLLQSTAVTNGSSQINNIYGGFVTNGGPGANTLSLRGLGTSRSLILLNGRRLAPSGSRGSVGSVDLNVIPTAVVDRIEVLNAGASSIYGSDAIAGVVNVITRNKVKGLELNAQVNVPARGAGIEKRVAAVFGASTERFDFTVSAEVYKRDEFQFGDRGDFQCVTDKRRTGIDAAPDSASYIDPRTGQPKCYGIAAGTGTQGVTVNTVGTQSYNGTTVALAPGVPAGYGALPTSAGFGAPASQICNRFRPNPMVTTGALPGFECVGGGLLSTDIRDTFPRSILTQSLFSPTKNYNGFASASYKLDSLGNAEVYAELVVSRRKSNQVGNRQFTLDYSQGSLLLPTSLRNGAMANYSFASFPGALPGLVVAARAFLNFGNYDNFQTSDYVKFGGGIRGDLPHDFHYDAYVSKSWADAKYTTQTILTNRVIQSLDVVASGTGFACRNVAGGCVAAPALTADLVGGNIPAAYKAYIAPFTTGRTNFRETVASLSIDGGLFNLPGGQVQAVIGGEYRKQSINDQPSNDSVQGNLLGFTSALPTVGSDSVYEVFGELELPVIHDSFIYDFDITASGRYTHYKSYGGDETYKIGANIAPVQWLRFRGSYGTSYRAPALFEQFLGATTGFNGATTDICNNLTAATAPVRLANCQKDGLPLGFVATQGVQVNQLGGAASGLASEKSKNYNAGVVFQPKFSFGNFSLAADYFSIKVKNGVSLLSSATVQSQCYDDPLFRANAVCNFVQRSPVAPFNLVVTTGYINISNAVARGIDFTGRFSTDVGPGQFRVGVSLTDFIKRYSQTLPTDTIVNLIGKIQNPKWTGTGDVSYAIDKFNLRYGIEWVQHTDSVDYVGADDTYDFRTRDYFTHTLSANYRSNRFEFSLGVRNFTDEKPPVISSGAYQRIGNAALYSGYDFIGRTYFMNVVTKF